MVLHTLLITFPNMMNYNYSLDVHTHIKTFPPPPQQHKPSVFHVIFLICVRKMGCMKVGGKLYIDDGEEQQRLFTSVERVAETVLEMLKPCQHHFAGTKYRRGISSCSGRFATLWQ